MDNEVKNISDVYRIISENRVEDFKKVLNQFTLLESYNGYNTIEDEIHMTRFFATVKSEEIFKLMFDYLLAYGKDHKKISERNIVFPFKINIDKKIINNLSKYESLFTNYEAIVKFLLFNKSYSNIVLQKLEHYKDKVYDPFFIYLRRTELLSLYEVYNICFNNKQIPQNIFMNLIEHRLNYDNIKDIIRLYREIPDFKNNLDNINKDYIIEKSISKIKVNNLDEIESKYVIEISKLFKENGIKISDISLKKSYLNKILYNLNTLINDKSNLNKLINILYENRDFIIKNKIFNDELNLEVFPFLYEIDKKLTKYLLSYCADLNLYYQISDINNLKNFVNKIGSDRFIEIFKEYIIENFYEIPEVIVIDRVGEDIIYQNSFTFTNDIINYIYNSDKVEKEVFDLALKYIRFQVIEDNNIDYKILVNRLIKKDIIIKYYIPKDSSSKEVDLVMKSLKVVMEDIKNESNSRIKFFKLKDLKQYITYLNENFKIDIKFKDSIYLQSIKNS